MKKLWVFLAVLCLLTGLFALFSPREQSARGVAVQVDIYRYDRSDVQHLSLSDSRQISTVLQFLRSLESHDPAQTVPPAKGTNYAVLVHLANGHRHLYRLRNGRFFCRDNGEWMRISPQLGAKFSDLSKELAATNPNSVKIV